jgi:acyl carrier protein
MHDIETRLTECFAATFADLPFEEIPQAHVETVDGWDSMTTMILLSVIEEEFVVRVPSEDVLRFTSFNEIMDYLHERDGSRGGQTVEPQQSTWT